MFRYFVPFSGARPAAVHINGHKLLVVCSDRCDLEESLGLFGADTVKSVGDGVTKEDCHDSLEQLAEKISGDVVIAPEDVSLEVILSDLEQELPWIQ